MFACGKGIIASDTPLEKRAICFRCKGWGCEFCGPVNLRDLRAVARKGRPSWRLDLTIKQQPGKTPSEEAQAMVHMWRMVRQWSERLREDRIEFLAIFERHPSSGRPHLHILLRCRRIDAEQLRAYLTRLNETRQFKLKHITNSRKAINYATKYAAKDPERFDGCKRWWKSRGWTVEADDWTPPVMDRDAVWELREVTPYEWMHACLCAGFQPEEKRPGYWEARPRERSPMLE